MARAIWKGSLAFGLVNVPIELHTAVRDSRPRFRMLHRQDESPIENQRVCRRDGKPVAWEDLVKGYEYAKGQFVVLTKDDFETAALEKSRTIEILEFVDGDAIDDRFFEQPYYLAPARGAERAYAVLREALRKSKQVGVSRFIMRETQHLAALEVAGDAMVLTMMRFAQELVDTKPLNLPEKSLVRDKELEMAIKLVESLSDTWQPEKYKDEYRENLMRVIDAKVKGKQPKLTSAPSAPGQADVVDLMERLRKSLKLSPSRDTGARGAVKEAPNKAAAKKSTSASKPRVATTTVSKRARARKAKRTRHAA
jgi:DNA end-binding protein Ku